MTWQRRRGQPITLWPSVLITDKRGNKVEIADKENPLPGVKGWVIPQRSARAEVPGQQKINVVRIGVDANLAGITLWSQAEWLGKSWDIVTPPAFHYGTRHTRHWSIDLRERP